MPRIHKPSQTAISANPRAYAIYKQAVPSSGDVVDDEVLKNYITLYGDPKKAVESGELSFEEFASLFSRPGTAEGTNCVGWAARDKGSALAPYSFDRRPVGPTDVRIQITHAGICHSDIHQARDEWGGSLFPMVPGHEIVGIVTEVGGQVTRFAVGDRAGVGCMVDSCRACDTCAKGEEQFCGKCTYTYNCKQADGNLAQGGYSTHIVVTEDFALRIPDALPLDRTAPLLCAGITVYSPLRHYGLDRPGTRLGVVGLGGLGHMAVLIAKAMGAHVTVISTSRHKQQEALGLLGADAFLLSNDAAAMQSAASSLDGIIDTVSAKHDLSALVGLLRVDGKLVMVGVPDVPLEMPAAAIVFKRVQIGGSLIGGIRETQEMLDFCAQHGVAAITETIPIDQVNEAYTRMIKSDVKYRFVIDITSSLVA